MAVKGTVQTEIGNALVYLGGVGAYREECDAVVANDYAGFEMR